MFINKGDYDMVMTKRKKKKKSDFFINFEMVDRYTGKKDSSFKGLYPKDFDTTWDEIKKKIF